MKRGYTREWYNMNRIMSSPDYWFRIIIGSRSVGKSYACMDWCLNQNRKHGTVFYWLRINEPSVQKMLQNDAAQFVDPDLVRKYKLKLKVSGNLILNNGRPLAYVFPLSTAASSKGAALFDKDYHGRRIVVFDEFQLEKGQRRCFDLCYNLVIMLENIFRTNKGDNNVIMMANNTEESSEVLTMITHFIPTEFGMYRNKRRKWIIDYLPNSEKYLQNRKGSVADILDGDSANFTNKITTDIARIRKKRQGCRPYQIIKFTKDEAGWYTLWEDYTISLYNKEDKPGVAMCRYIDEVFYPEKRDVIQELFDTRVLHFVDLFTYKKFQYELKLIKTK